MTASGAPPELPKQPGGSSGQKRADGHAPAKLGGRELPVQYWAAGLIGALLIVGLGVYAVKERSELQKSNQRNEESDKKPPPTSTQFDEGQKHVGQKPDFKKTVTIHERLSLIVEYFPDKCLRVTRHQMDPNGTSQFAWYMPDRSLGEQPAPGKIIGDNRIGRPEGQEVAEYGAGQAARLIHASVPAPSASLLFGSAAGAGASIPIFESAGDHRNQRSSACNGACQDPHPGQFKSWYGETRDCWVQVWRQWPDGCTHYQWYNKCNSYWDPKTYWTCCVH